MPLSQRGGGYPAQPPRSSSGERARHLSAFAAASSSAIPLHTELAAARLAGLEAPIVHGMWLSAVTSKWSAESPPP